jgi:hypothetical protein
MFIPTVIPGIECLLLPGGGSGVFTNLFVDALGGAAANLVGDVTPGSVYAHIDQSLGPWAQRPVFKTNVKTFVSLRKATPPISLADLQAIATHFPVAGYNCKLDPSYEPERSEEQRKDLVSRWERQLNTKYAELDEQEKASDRERVEKYLPLIASALSSG